MNNLIFKKNCGTVQNRVTVSLAIILKIKLSLQRMFLQLNRKL